MSERAVRGMTILEFLAWQSGQRDRYELVDGRPVAMTGARLRHDRVTGNAFGEIRRQLRANGNPCDAFTADIAIVTPSGNVRRPDMSVLCPPFDDEALTTDRPRLVVEVLSESTAQIDRLVKLGEYQSIETLDYIVFADPTRVDVGVWYRDDARLWRNRVFQDLTAAVEMPALGLSVGLASLYERVSLPPRPRLRLMWDEEEESQPPGRA